MSQLTRMINSMEQVLSVIETTERSATMSDMSAADKARAAMRQQNSNNLTAPGMNPNGRLNAKIPVSADKARFAKSHPGPYRQDSAPEMPKDPLWGGKPPIPPEHI